MIYDKEISTSMYNIPVNKGNEASVYLKYIIDYYDNLSEYTFFIHDEEFSWHHEGSIYDQFQNAINSKEKYYNINHLILGSIINVPAFANISIWYNKYIEEYIPINSLPQKDWTKNHKGAAQFLVHKSLILKLPKIFYENLYNWIITTDEPSSSTGRYLEWTWHLFWDILW